MKTSSCRADQHPVFLGSAPFEARFDLQVRAEIHDGNTIVRIAAPLGTLPPGTPPPVPESFVEIELSGVHKLDASDFIL
jgi:hypothetical protein